MIYVPIYNFDIEVITDDWNEFLESKGVDINQDAYNGLTYTEYENLKIVILIKEDTTVFEIAHECLHVTNYILDWIGYKFDIDNDEPQTYLFEYIFERVMDETNVR